MKILLFIDSLAAGGAQRQLVGLANLLKNEGHQIQVATYFDVPFYSTFLAEHHIDYVCIKNSANKKLRFFKVIEHFRKYRPEIVISFLDTPNILAILTRLFVTRYQLIVSERNTTQNLTLRERIKFYLFRYADYIVPNSHAQTRFIKKHYPKLSDKVTTVTNFVDTTFFYPKTQMSSPSGTIKILAIGRVAPQKNILRFIEAIYLASTNGIKVVVDWYGNGYANDGMSNEYSDYYIQCMKTIEKYNLSPIFHFRPPVRDVLPLYQECDLFCLPSIYEGFPNVLCEAMACGKIAIVSKVCDNPDLIKEGENGFLFDPVDVEQIYGAIEKFSLLSSEKRKIMETNNRKFAEATFSTKAFIDKYLKLLGA